VHQYNGISNELITPSGYLKENGKPVIDKKTKEPKLLEDPQYLLFKKCESYEDAIIKVVDYYDKKIDKSKKETKSKAKDIVKQLDD